MALKLGNWKLNVNGDEGTLQIDSVSADGQVQGVIYIRDPTGFDGIWDDTARSISMVPSLALGDDPGRSYIRFAFFKGLLFSTPATPQPGQDVLWTLTGFVEVSNLNSVRSFGGNARRHTFGWFAQITEVA